MVSSLLARFVIVTVGILYPAYRSYKSLVNSDLREVVNCLRYWVVFAIFITCEAMTDIFLSWFPFYYWIKIGVVFWIVSPMGSTFLYKRYIQPLLKEREQEIDQLLEDTRQRGYSAIVDLTNKGVRYASNVVLNTAVFGQNYLGEHLKRSYSASDINNSSTKNTAEPPATLHEESEGETNLEFTNRLKEDRNYLAKGTNRKPLSNYQAKPEESSKNPLDDYEMSSVIHRKTRNNRISIMEILQRQMKETKSTKKLPKENEHDTISSNETDDEV